MGDGPTEARIEKSQEGRGVTTSITIWRLLLVVGLDIILAIIAVYLVERSIEGALKAVKVALKFEFTTDVGKLNLAGMIFFVVLLIFGHLHETLANAMSVEKPASADSHFLAPVILFGLGFVGSLVCVLIMERKGK